MTENDLQATGDFEPADQGFPEEWQTRAPNGEGPNGDPASHSWFKRLSSPQVLLCLNAAVMAFLVGMLLTVLRRGSGATAGKARKLRVTQRQRAASHRAPPIGAPRAVSWPAAEQHFSEKRYDKALSRYRDLLEVSMSSPAEAPTRQLYRFRIAQCLRQLGEGKAARELFESVSAGPCAVLRGAANYWLAAKHVEDGEYLQARMRAYTAIAELGRLQQRSPLVTDCDFLIARSLTQKSMTFYNSQARVPWPPLYRTDPFAGLDESALRELLRAQTGGPVHETLGPQIKRAHRQAMRRLWSVACRRAPLEELLHRFAVASDQEVSWVSVAPPVRRRPISLRWSEISAQRLGEVACGSAGLVARFTGDRTLVHDPLSDGPLSGQRELLLAEAVSSWRRFFIHASKDGLIPKAHFALASVYEFSGDTVAAMREYRLVGHRFEAADDAPQALLRAAKLRIYLKDYAGAHTDLLHLLNMYPKCRSVGEVYFNLGRVCLEIGRLEEAARTFRELYHMNLSLSTRVQAALGAGRCEYQGGNYKKAVEWLSGYIRSARGPLGKDLPEAYYTLAESQAALGKSAEAVNAFYEALAAKPSPAMYVQTVLGLVRVHLQREEYVAAVGALQRLEGRDLSAEQSYELLVLKAKAYRAMKLVDTAIRDLRRRIQAVTDPQMRALAGVELAKCYSEAGDLAASRELLAAALLKMKPGPAAWNASCDLAEVCLKIGETGQAIIVARGVLKSSCPPDVRQRALEILVACYVSRQDYVKAARVIPGGAETSAGAKG